MLIFGHRFIKSVSFYHITDIDAIIHTPPSSTLFLEFKEENLDIINHLQENSINFALEVHNITDAIYASALECSYIVVNKKIMKSVQNIAESYIFDAKILVLIDNEKDIEEIGILGIDGVLFSNAIVKISS